MPVYGRGAVPSPPDQRDFPFDAGHYGAPVAADLPAAVDLRCGGQAPTPRRPLGPVRDQGAAASCVGHAATGLREALRTAAGAPFVRYSPLFTWERARCVEGSDGSNTGCTPRDALESLRHDGALREELWPYDAGAFNVAPSAAMFSAARPFSIAGYHRCAGDVTVRQALAAPAPVLAVIRAGPAFEQTPASGIVTRAALEEACDWNHAILIAGYTPDWWLCQNSWGRGFGAAGYFYVPSAAFDTFFLEPWTASLRTAVSPITGGSSI